MFLQQLTQTFTEQNCFGPRICLLGQDLNNLPQEPCSPTAPKHEQTMSEPIAETEVEYTRQHTMPFPSQTHQEIVDQPEPTFLLNETNILQLQSHFPQTFVTIHSKCESTFIWRTKTITEEQRGKEKTKSKSNLKMPNMRPLRDKVKSQVTWLMFFGLSQVCLAQHKPFVKN